MKKRFLLNLLLCTSIFVLFSCNNNAKKDKASHSAKNNKHPHWSYAKGEKGPENWANICEYFSACGGKSQSPINLKTVLVDSVVDLVSIKFNYRETKVNIDNNGHTVEFIVSDSNSVELDGKKYDLLQFHYHALSEHTIDGKHFPLEVHFVHKHSDSDYAVLSVMIKEGDENALFAKYLSYFPSKKGEYSSSDKIDLLSLFPDNKSYFNYSGSLTTPPCSEFVNWYVLKTPVTASKKQIETFSKILHNNYRPLQALNGRSICAFKE